MRRAMVIPLGQHAREQVKFSRRKRAIKKRRSCDAEGSHCQTNYARTAVFIVAFVGFGKRTACAWAPVDKEIAALCEKAAGKGK